MRTTDKSDTLSAPGIISGKRRKTLIFHIGDHKTGSTSIQAAFAQRQISLKDHTAFYPADFNHNHLIIHCRGYAAPDKPARRKKAINVFTDLAQKIRDSDADFCLISGETLEGANPAGFQDIIDTFFADTVDDYRIISYVRPHAARFLSAFAERTKIGQPDVLGSTLEGIFKQVNENRSFHYLPRLTAWRDQFGDRFQLRPMIRNQLYQNSVVDDFIRHAFDLTDFQISAGAQANESLDVEDLMRLKVLQSHLLSDNGKLRLAMGWEFARVLKHLPPLATRTKLRLHKSLARDIHASYLDDARAVDQQFFDGAPLLENELSSALDTAVDSPMSVEPADYLSETDLRSLAILSDIITGLVQNKKINWHDYLHSKIVDEVRIVADAVET